MVKSLVEGNGEFVDRHRFNRPGRTARRRQRERALIGRKIVLGEDMTERRALD